MYTGANMLASRLYKQSPCWDNANSDPCSMRGKTGKEYHSMQTNNNQGMHKVLKTTLLSTDSKATATQKPGNAKKYKVHKL